MKKCVECGKLINEQVKECPGCGAVQATSAPATPMGAGAPPPPGAGEGPVPGPSGPAVVSHVQLGEYAGFWIRFGAFFIDNFIALIITFIVMIPFGGLAVFAMLSQGVQQQEAATMNAAVNMIGNLVWFAVWGVNSVYLQGTRGWTIGKRVCNIVVLNDNGEVLGIGRNLLREIFKAWISSCVCFLGFLWAAFDSENQTWHDKVAGSHVYYD